MSFMARAQPYRRWYRLDNRFLTVAASLVGRHLDCAHHAGIAGRDVLAVLVHYKHHLEKLIVIVSIGAATVVQTTHFGQYPLFACAANLELVPTWRDAPPKVSQPKKSNAVLNATSSVNCIP